MFETIRKANVALMGMQTSRFFANPIDTAKANKMEILPKMKFPKTIKPLAKRLLA